MTAALSNTTRWLRVSVKKKKKSVVNKGMLLFIIKKVTAQITTKFVTIHQITSLSGPGITVFGGNQSTLPEINGRMRTFIINSYQSISKRSLTFREERTISIPLCRKRSLKVIRSALNVLSISQMNFWACGLLPDETFRSLNYYFYFDYTSQVLRLMKEHKQWHESFPKTSLLRTIVLVFLSSIIAEFFPAI